ncbi:hypothetical protein TEA_024920 [Camellia sinensis var. sinensis]|uniref:Uncharacterized protein n=1 Tax=Camellia sinensis var. sinensis TaxID=542762 RepID=A0A4S4CZC0_CAMSN|nr:hypothetical protein TEA_024920 [Camellia sinensis var. sinensis]
MYLKPKVSIVVSCFSSLFGCVSEIPNLFFTNRGLGEKGTIVFSDVEHAILKNDRSLQEVFKLFDLIHIVTTDHKILTRIAQEVVEDFATENVVYLELKTTPTEPLKVSRLLKEIIKVSSGYHHSSAITGRRGGKFQPKPKVQIKREKPGADTSHPNVVESIPCPQQAQSIPSETEYMNKGSNLAFPVAPQNS